MSPCPDDAVASDDPLIILSENAEELHLRGLTAYQRGEHEQAVAMLEKAIQLQPTSATLYSNLAVMLHALGRLSEALTSCNRALAINPEMTAAWLTLGNILQEQVRPRDALAAYQRAFKLGPDDTDARASLATAYVNVGAACQEEGNYDEAVDHYRRSEALDPSNFPAQLNLGVALRLQGQAEEALASCERALQLDPNHFGAQLNLAIALEEMARLDEALAGYRRAVELGPEVRDAHLRLGLAALRRGDFDLGWREYEWRWGSSDMPGAKPGFTTPAWDGSALGGRRLLLYTEQGFGDTLQFVRYVPLIHGGEIVLQCRPELKRLLASSLDGIQVVSASEPLPPVDINAALLSCPGLLGTRLDSIPAHVPYLRASSRLSARWRKRLASDARLKVGLVWATNTLGLAARRRSFHPELLRPLSDIPGIHLISLQQSASGETTMGVSITHAGSELGDFADTAALVSQLDLVISIDTAVAHLAGGLGRPVWLLLPFVSDWRWLVDRQDSPWYPTMRLFRQQRAGDWEGVIADVASCLRALANA